VLLAALATLLVVATPAGAAPSCGRAVIDDWYEDGRVDGTYALHCYDDAIETLPRDVRDYSNAKEEIQRALQAAKRGEDAPPARTDPTPGASTSPEDPDEPTTESTATPPTSGPTDGDGESETVAGGLNAESDSASSVPIPLLILAGLALLLILAGTAGYVIRRLQARRLPPPRSN
jgi:cobalamin biosynthesis Mg chelatase CobN